MSRVVEADDLLIDLEDIPERPAMTFREEVSLEDDGLPMSPIVPPTSYVKAAPRVFSAASVVSSAELTSFFDFSKSTLSPIQQLYIMSFAIRGTKTRACAIADVSSKQVDVWMKNDEFSEALQAAMNVVGDALEEELIKRAMEGSDKLLLRALEAHKPEKYARRIDGRIDVVHSWADLARKAIDEGAIPEED